MCGLIAAGQCEQWPRKRETNAKALWSLTSDRVVRDRIRSAHGTAPTMLRRSPAIDRRNFVLFLIVQVDDVRWTVTLRRAKPCLVRFVSLQAMRHMSQLCKKVGPIHTSFFFFDAVDQAPRRCDAHITRLQNAFVEPNEDKTMVSHFFLTSSSNYVGLIPCSRHVRKRFLIGVINGQC